eukprot:122013_1
MSTTHQHNNHTTRNMESTVLPYYALKQLYDVAQIEIKILKKKADILQKQSSEQTLKFRKMEHKLQLEFNQEAAKYSQQIHELEQLLSYHTTQHKEHLLTIQKLRDGNRMHQTHIQRLTVANDNLSTKNSKIKSDLAGMRELHIEIDRLHAELCQYTQCSIEAIQTNLSICSCTDHMKDERDTDMPSPTSVKHIQYSFLRTPKFYPMVSHTSTPGTPSAGLRIYVRSSTTSLTPRSNSIGSPYAFAARTQKKQFSFCE